MEPGWIDWESDELYKTLILNSPAAIVFLDREGRVITSNPAFEALFGYTCAEALGEELDALVTDKELYREAATYTRRILVDGLTVRATGRRRRKDGTYLHAEMQGAAVRGAEGQLGVLVIYQDITDRLKAEKNLEEVFGSLEMILDSLDADVYVSSLDSYEILFMNQHMCGSFGGDFSGQTCHQVFRNQPAPCAHCSNPRLLDAQGRPTGTYTWEGRNPITQRWYKNSDRVIHWSDGRYVRLQIATDITEQKEAEARLEHLATHDPLSGLPNRYLFMERLQHSIKRARRNRRLLAVLFVDIDGFKDINDRFGHAAGDELLRQMGCRLCSAVREFDTVARISGDEFAVILEELPAEDIADRIAARLLETAAQPTRFDVHELAVTVSIGLARFPRDAGNPEGLLNKADAAMYGVKRRGKNGLADWAGQEQP